jgi:hypothetical protein
MQCQFRKSDLAEPATTARGLSERGDGLSMPASENLHMSRHHPRGGRASIIRPDYCKRDADRRHRLAGRDGAAIPRAERRMADKDQIVMRRVASTIIERSI